MQKLFLFSNVGFMAAITAHLVFLNFFTFRFGPPTSQHNVKIVFLGAILDPFEVEKIKPPVFSPKFDIVLPQEQPTAQRPITATKKPNLGTVVQTHPKAVFKLPPQAQSQSSPIFANPAETLKDPASRQPYQHLKLYP